MWELSRNHCCATCSYSRKLGCLVETSCPRQHVGKITEEDLFPLAGNLLCAYCRESLGETSVQAVLVCPDGRCDGYECHTERYLALHGVEPLEDEELYALDLTETCSNPFSGHGFHANA